MKRSKKTFNDQQVSTDRESGAVLKNSELKWGPNPMTLVGFIVVLLMVLTVVFSVAFFFGDLPSDCLWTLAEARIFHVKHSKATVSEKDIPQPLTVPKDKLLGGLLPTGFDETSCLSRVKKIRSSSQAMQTLTSAFLYALLTNRVLLVDPRANLHNLFCEPFPEVSWLLPPDFPSFLYLHLSHDFDVQDKLFFCDTDQTFLHKVPWLFVKSNNYYVPALFLIPSFEQELNNLFPEKETVFHFLGRYLFHPTNSVWGLITRYYQAYLAQADEKIGIQIRVFSLGVSNFKYVLNQILACTTKENLLPQVNLNAPIVNSSGKMKTISVLMTSLSSQYFEEIKNMYWQNPTVTGEIVSVFQPSHEEHQQTEKLMHDRKALAEMYLLSLTDKLVTSGWSTFGYVAYSLGGLKPWILYKFKKGTVHNPPCFRATSLEPCYHSPPYYEYFNILSLL